MGSVGSGRVVRTRWMGRREGSGRSGWSCCGPQQSRPAAGRRSYIFAALAEGLVAEPGDRYGGDADETAGEKVVPSEVGGAQAGVIVAGVSGGGGERGEEAGCG